MTTFDKTVNCVIILKNKAFESLLRWRHGVIRTAEVAGSNPVAPIFVSTIYITLCGGFVVSSFGIVIAG